MTDHPPTAATPENFRTVYEPPTADDREALALTFVDVLNQVWHHQLDVLGAAHRLAGFHRTPEPRTGADAPRLVRDAIRAEQKRIAAMPDQLKTWTGDEGRAWQNGMSNVARIAEHALEAALGTPLEPRTVSTVEELEALPIQSIVMSAAGTVACRFDEKLFVCFGDDRPGEPWSRLALPARVLFAPDGDRDA
jgi:hypothetical protein